MSDARLTNLAILSIEKELADESDFENVISEFAARKAQKKFVCKCWERILWLNKYIWLVVYAHFCLNW